MTTNTTNFNLIKPLQGDFYDVGITNENMDTLDEILKALQDAINSGASEQDLAALQAALVAHSAETKYEDVSRIIYVKTTGDDNNGDGSLASPFKTITKALSTVNKNISNTITIRVFPGDYRSEGNINFRNYRGTSLILTAYDGTSEVITPNDDYIVERITMYDSEVIFVQGFKCSQSTPAYGIYMSNCRFVKLEGLKIEEPGNSGLGCTGNSFVWVENSTANNLSTVISANHGATVVSQNWINSTVNDNGIVVDVGSKVHLYDDNQPIAHNKYTQRNAGVIFDKDGQTLFSPQVIVATRDLTLTGTQTIAISGKPKKIVVRAFVNSTIKKSYGTWAKNAQTCDYVSGSYGFSFDGGEAVVVIEDSPGNYTRAIISSFSNGSFVLTWDKGGSGAVGTVILKITIE